MPGIRKFLVFRKILSFVTRLLGWWYPRGRNVHHQWHLPSGVNSYQRNHFVPLGRSIIIAIKGLRIIILYARRAFRLHNTHQWRSKQLKSQRNTKVKSIEDRKFLKVVPNTAKVIYSCDKKINKPLLFQQTSNCTKWNQLYSWLKSWSKVMFPPRGIDKGFLIIESETMQIMTHI